MEPNGIEVDRILFSHGFVPHGLPLFPLLISILQQKDDNGDIYSNVTLPLNSLLGFGPPDGQSGRWTLA